MARLLAAAVVLLLLAGCETVQVPLVPRVDGAGLPAQVPGAVALLVTDATRAYVFSGRPDSLTGATRTHRFALGEALESASRQAFSRVFREVTLVRTRDAATGQPIVLEPTVVEFRFRYDSLRYAGFASAAAAWVRLRVTATRDGAVVWTRTVESPEQVRGPFGEKTRERGMAEAASAAVAAAVARLAGEAAVNPAVLQAVAAR